jgi:hypothetical protein
MIQTRLGEPEDKVDAQERATLTKLQEELYSVEVSTTLPHPALQFIRLGESSS